MTRAGWKYWYREMRIHRRENEKAVIDVVLYGTGIMRMDADGMHQIPFREFYAARIAEPLHTPPVAKPPQRA